MGFNSRQAVVVLLLEDELVLPAERVGAAVPLALGQVAAVGQDEVGAQVGDDGGRRPDPDGIGSPGSLVGIGDHAVTIMLMIMLAVTMVINVTMVFTEMLVAMVVVVLVVMVVVVFFIGEKQLLAVLTQNHAHHRHQ